MNEKLIIEEPRIYVERTVTPTYVCPCCKGGKHDSDTPCVIKQAPAIPAILLNLTHKVEHFPIVVEGVEFL